MAAGACGGAGARPEGRACGRLEQLLGLRQQQRQRNRPDVLDFELRRQQLSTSNHEVIARPVNFSKVRTALAVMVMTAP